MRLVNSWTQAKRVRDRQLKMRLADDMRAALESAGPDPSPNAVNAAMGRLVVETEFECQECNKSKGELIELGTRIDWEQDYTYVCAECLLKALQMIDS